MRSIQPLPIAPGFIVLALGSAIRPSEPPPDAAPPRNVGREREMPLRRLGNSGT